MPAAAAASATVGVEPQREIRSRADATNDARVRCFCRERPVSS
jgi:hypothetical protein